MILREQVKRPWLPETLVEKKISFLTLPINEKRQIGSKSLKDSRFDWQYYDWLIFWKWFWFKIWIRLLPIFWFLSCHNCWFSLNYFFYFVPTVDKKVKSDNLLLKGGFLREKTEERYCRLSSVFSHEII